MQSILHNTYNGPTNLIKLSKYEKQVILGRGKHKSWLLRLAEIICQKDKVLFISLYGIYFIM